MHAGPPAQPFLVRKAAAYVTRILSVFGISTAAPDQLGFGGEASAAASTSEGTAKYLDAFALFRDNVRRLAKSDKSSADILAACDRSVNACFDTMQNPLRSEHQDSYHMKSLLLQAPCFLNYERPCAAVVSTLAVVHCAAFGHIDLTDGKAFLCVVTSNSGWQDTG